MPTSVTILRGDTFKFPVKLSIDGVYQDFTGGFVYFTLKTNQYDPDDQAIVSKKVAGTGTETWVECTPAETVTWLTNQESSKSYYGDVQVQLASGDTYSDYMTVLVKYDITRRIT